MGLNFLAIGVMTVVAFVLGWLWFSPVLFVKKWMQYLDLKPDPNQKPEPMMFIKALLSNFVTMYVIARVVHYAAADSMGRGAIIGGMLAIGLMAAPNFNGQVNFLKKPVGLWLIDNGYVVVSAIIAGAVFAVWH